MSIAIVTVGYNRPDSMLRLLESIGDADYGNDRVDLVVSIDKGLRQDEIIKVAEEFIWKKGEKIIRAFPERQGLRPHGLQCGDLTKQYDAVIVLEDDITVSCGFYDYVKQCIEFYGNDDRISGISLYKHRLNPGNGRPFEPAEDGNDVYFMQMAQSWGQCWTRKMWNGFKSWYENNQGKIKQSADFPAYITAWDDRSWMKYYDKYDVEMDKFHVYPYKALSTNHSETGEHSIMTNNAYQVPLLEGKMNYRLPELESGIKYDIFFERIGLSGGVLAELNGKVLMDLQGLRSNYGDADYLISTRVLPFKVIKTIQLEYRPIEVNCIKQVEGKGIRVYDLKCAASKKGNKAHILRYDRRGLRWKNAFLLGYFDFLNDVKRKIYKLIK